MSDRGSLSFVAGAGPLIGAGIAAPSIPLSSLDGFAVLSLSVMIAVFVYLTLPQVCDE